MASGSLESSSSSGARARQRKEGSGRGALLRLSGDDYGAFLAQQNSIAGAATAVNTCTTAVLGRVLTGGMPENIVVTDPGAGGLTAAAAMSVGTTGMCLFAHSAAPAALVTASIIKVM